MLFSFMCKKKIYFFYNYMKFVLNKKKKKNKLFFIKSNLLKIKIK